MSRLFSAPVVLAMSLTAYLVPAQVPSGSVVAGAVSWASGDPAAYVLDPSSLQITALPAVKDVSGAWMNNSGNGAVPYSFPEQFVYTPSSSSNTPNGLGIAHLSGSRITQFTFLNQLRAPRGATIFRSVQPWRDGMITAVVSVDL